MLFTTSFSYKNQSISSAALVTKNDELVLSGFMYDNSLTPYRGFNVFLRLDANGQVLHSKRIFSTDTGIPVNIAEATDGGLYEVGGFQFINPYASELYLKKYAFDGTMGNCMTESYDYLQETTAWMGIWRVNHKKRALMYGRVPTNLKGLQYKKKME